MLPAALPAEPLSESPRQRFALLKADLEARSAGQAADVRLFSTGFAALDAALGGGLQPGALSTLEGAPSSGRTAMLGAMFARVTRHGYGALVDDGSCYPPALERGGVALDRLLVVHADEAIAAARCADILLRARTFGLVAMPAFPLRAVVWSRLCTLAQRAGTVLLALGTHASPELASFASTRLRCGIERVRWNGENALFAELAGYELCATVLKARKGRPGSIARLHVNGKH